MLLYLCNVVMGVCLGSSKSLCSYTVNIRARYLQEFHIFKERVGSLTVGLFFDITRIWTKMLVLSQQIITRIFSSLLGSGKGKEVRTSKDGWHP